MYRTDEGIRNKDCVREWKYNMETLYYLLNFSVNIKLSYKEILKYT